METENCYEEVLNENIYHQSFHRFCDDVCGEILIFLPISDKVSKQFQRCLRRKQTILEISDNVFSRNNFKECLIKSVGLHFGRKVQIFNLKWRGLIKVLKKFKLINGIRITKTRLSKVARENALQIIYWLLSANKINRIHIWISFLT